MSKNSKNSDSTSPHGSRKLSHSVSIADCRVEALASTGGNGGQNRNRRHTAIRITHEPSGAVGFSADERSQLQNKQVAFRRMGESKTFRLWALMHTCELESGKTIEQRVDEDMTPDKILMEVQDEHGRWVRSGTEGS